MCSLWCSAAQMPDHECTLWTGHVIAAVQLLSSLPVMQFAGAVLGELDLFAWSRYSPPAIWGMLKKLTHVQGGQRQHG